MKITIYTLEDPVTNDIKYIGITGATLKERLSGHIKDAKYSKALTRKSGKERWIINLINQGLNPIIQEIETIDATYKFIEDYVEMHWMWQFKSWGFDLFNINGIVDNFAKMSEQLRYKTPINQYDLNGNFIKRYESVASAAKIVDGNSSKLQRAAKLKSGYKSYGYQWRYDKDKLPIIEKAKSIRLPNINRIVIQCDLNGNEIQTWKSGQEAAKSLKLLKSKISNCCNKKRKTHGGYIWKFKD